MPVILFTKGSAPWLASFIDSGADAIGLDWTADLGVARQLVGHQLALQGNLDPAILRAPVDTIREQVKRVLGNYGSGSGHVFNLGHGVTPDIDPDHAAAMIDAVVEYSPAYHGTKL